MFWVLIEAVLVSINNIYDKKNSLQICSLMHVYYTIKMVYNKDTDQTAQMCSLISAIVVPLIMHFNGALISYPCILPWAYLCISKYTCAYNLAVQVHL